MKRILVAGLGNIFLGDDAFGVEVAKELMKCTWPDGVQVAEFGIRSYDLAYAMMDGYDTTVLIDATQQGGAPGTLYLIEPDLGELDQLGGKVVSAHSMNPARVLHLVQSLGGVPGTLYLVGCEPGVLETEGGRLGLSEPVRAAVPGAVKMVRELVAGLLGAGQHQLQECTEPQTK